MTDLIPNYAASRLPVGGDILDACAAQQGAPMASLADATKMTELYQQGFRGGAQLTTDMVARALNSPNVRQGVDRIGECFGNALSSLGQTNAAMDVGKARMAYQNAWFGLRQQGFGR